MTLREKFYTYTDNEYSEKLTNAENCEKIADDFAIGFAEWCVIKKVRFFDDTEESMIFTVDLYTTKYTTKELLEIYKKEKGL
jgi:hypothetical protein